MRFTEERPGFVRVYEIGGSPFPPCTDFQPAAHIHGHILIDAA